MWVMTSRRFQGGVEFAIGAIKIAEIGISRPSGRWEYELRLAQSSSIWLNPHSRHSTFKAALQQMHAQLRAPAPPGFSTGNIFKPEPKTDSD